MKFWLPDCKSHAVCDVPGVCFKVVKGANVSFGLIRRQEGKTKIIGFDGDDNKFSYSKKISKSTPKLNSWTDPRPSQKQQYI